MFSRVLKIYVSSLALILVLRVVIQTQIKAQIATFWKDFSITSAHF